MRYQVKTYYSKEELPLLEGETFFHCSSSFNLYERIPFYKPLMLVIFDEGRPIAHMFALIMRINKLLRGSLFKKCYISQQPAFANEEANKIELFDLFMKALLKEIEYKVSFIEYRNVNDSVFGYKGFRENGFYSVKWINVRNSLQKKRNAWEQLSKTRKNQVNKAKRKGVWIEELTSAQKISEMYELIDKSNQWKLTKRFPPYQYFENFFKYYIQEKRGKIVITRYKEKIIGGAILGFEKESAYVLYYWGKDKTYKTLYPTVFTIYSAMEKIEGEGFRYFDFMDAGYLNVKTGRPRFLLQFGGKPRATRRWYRFNLKLLNFFAKKIYD